MAERAIIVGAGIGGLALGRALKADGWDVEIHERASQLPTTGTALGMWPEAMEALDALGLGDQVRDRGVLQRGAQFLRPDGTAFAHVRPDNPSYLVSRPLLYEILHDEALGDSVVWGSDINDPGKLPAADLIVGADGINSPLRQAGLGPKAAPRPLRTVAFRGVVPGSVDSVTETWGDGRIFGITPQEGATTNWFACVRHDVLADHDNGISNTDLLGSLFRDWHPAISAVLSKVDAGQIDRRNLYDAAPLGSFFQDNMVLIGDAAHAMAPNAGRGACETLVDAVDLATSLRSAGSVHDGLQNYDRHRRRQAQRVVRVSRLLNRMSTARRFTTLRHQMMNVLARFA
ncbi:FAD-dependent monooxygenase [Nesterenkonia ebinurensis]|uniref:FAD-dependent monooxygenase n=1 Tax=Nesterenkonia ebinurensis TaxID=2608252 RepID=UPI00123D7A04|nr:FAD-dependent monooxygenase [Nesterenkonia ebinurensis]